MMVGGVSFAYLIFVLNPIQVLSALIYPLSPRICRRVNRWCARSIWGLWVLLAEVQNGTKVRFTGDHIPPRENALLISNHQTMADIMTLLCFAWRCGRLGDVKWFVKDALKFVPGVGWGMSLLDCIFVKRDWTRDAAEIQRVFANYRDHGLPFFLVSFLEGSRLTPEKLVRAQAYAKDRGLYVSKRTLVPRTKGFLATIEGLSEHVDAIYDITIGYPDGVPPLLHCFGARVKRIELHIRRYPVESLPKHPDELTTWACDRFQEKDGLLAHMETNGAFPGDEILGPVRPLDFFLSESRVSKRYQPD